MTAAPDPGGASLRRDNGLVPERWSALASLDPAAGDEVLAALAEQGVAGLVESGPASSGAGAGPRTVGVGAGKDLLWVDDGLRERAAAVLLAGFAQAVTLLPPSPDAGPSPSGTPADGTPADGVPADGVPAAGQPGPAGEHGHELAGRERDPGVAPDVRRRPADQAPADRPPVDEDAAWAQIVAGWDRDDAGPVPPWPVNEDLGRSGTAPRGDAQRTAPDAPGDTDDAPAPLGPRDHSPAEDPADEHYVPPPPPPLPRLRRGTAAALLVLALGVVLLFVPGVVGFSGSDGVAITGIACIVGSVAALVHGMRDTGSGGGSGDDGAVV